MLNALYGDRGAIAVLVERYYRPLFSYLFRLTDGDRATAEDLLQDTFTRLLTRRSYVAGRPLKPWVYAIATNLVRDQRRQLARRGATEDVDCAADVADAEDASEALVRSEDERAIRAAIGSLGVEQRAAIVLRYYQGLSLSEIAQALGVPVGTVKSRLSIGTRRLRELLKPFLDDAIS